MKNSARKSTKHSTNQSSERIQSNKYSEYEQSINVCYLCHDQVTTGDIYDLVSRCIIHEVLRTMACTVIHFFALFIVTLDSITSQFSIPSSTILEDSNMKVDTEVQINSSDYPLARKDPNIIENFHGTQVCSKNFHVREFELPLYGTGSYIKQPHFPVSKLKAV